MMKLFLVILAVSTNVFAHQATVTNDGKRMFLPAPKIELNLENSSSFMSGNITKQIISETLNSWNVHSNQLDMKLVDTPAIFKIRFENDFSRFGSAVVGVTEINYNKEGAIQKATVRLNNNIHFSESKSAHRLGSIYLGDVLSHEIGHMIGLGHSEVPDASMFFESFPGQHTLAKDDIAGIRTQYGASGGVIVGTVMGGRSVPVLGAQIKAISRLSGGVVSTVSDEFGRFEIRGLDLNDSYFLYISPTVRVSDLPPYFANTQNNFCPETYKGGFFTACGVSEGGSAQAITLTSEKGHADVGVVSIHCSLRSSPEYARSKLGDSEEVLVLWDASDQLAEKNQIGYFFNSSEWSKWDKFKLDLSSVSNLNNNKFLKINFIAYPFGNPLEYEMKLMLDGVELKNFGITEDPVSKVFNNNISYDLPLAYPYDSGDYELHLRARNLVEECYLADGKICSRWTYPAPDLFMNSREMPYLLSVGLMEGVGIALFNTEQQLSDNRSCLEAPFTYEVKRNIASTEEVSTDQGAAQMGCGTIEPPAGNPPAGGLMTLCLGFMLASLTFLLKKTKNTLS